MKFKEYLNELQRRHVVKAGVAYLVIAWLIVQVLSILIPAFDLGQSLLKITITILSIGFPIWVIIAWIYDFTPQGIKRTEDMVFDAKGSAKKNVRLNRVIIGALSIALILLIVNQVRMTEVMEKQVMKASILPNFTSSIAILPFINLSNDPNQEYFSDGMMEEMLNHLVKIKNLKVTSRTSSMQYKMTAKSLGEIGNELGVRYLLEGSVRKYEDKVRISTQLIEVETDINLWSQSYDRKLVDIFDIQSEIAKNVASELSMILSPTEIEQIDKRGTKNLEAYNFYLQGRHFFHRRTDGYEELKKSIEYFEKSLAIDTLYAVAYAGLADANFLLAWRDSNVSSLNGSERVTNTKEYVRKALEIDPNLGEAHAVLGMMTCYFDWEWVEGGKILEKAIEISPNYSTAHQYYSEYLDAIRQSDAARLEINKALDLNPLSITLLQISSSHYFNEQKLDEALREVLKAKELDSNQPVVYWKMFHIYKEQGKEEKAIQQLKHLWSMDSSLAKHIKLMDDIYAENGMNGVVKWWMSFEENKNPNNPHYIAMNYAVIGEDKLALDWLERAFDLGGLHLPGMNNNRMFKNIRSDPRFISMLDRMGLVRENK